MKYRFLIKSPNQKVFFTVVLFFDVHFIDFFGCKKKKEKKKEKKSKIQRKGEFIKKNNESGSVFQVLLQILQVSSFLLAFENYETFSSIRNPKSFIIFFFQAQKIRRKKKINEKKKKRKEI